MRTPPLASPTRYGLGITNEGAQGDMDGKARLVLALLMSTRYPSVSKVITYVGQSNAAMSSINKKLSFKFHRQFGTYQIDRDAIGAWLSRERAGPKENANCQAPPTPEET